MYDDQTRKSRRLGAGLQGKYQLSAQTELFGEVAMEREYEDGSQDLTMALTSLPNNNTLEGYRPESHQPRQPRRQPATDAGTGAAWRLLPAPQRFGHPAGCQPPSASTSEARAGAARRRIRRRALRSPGTRGQLPHTVPCGQSSRRFCLPSAAVWRPAPSEASGPVR
jgi:hypothetical protein